MADNLADHLVATQMIALLIVVIVALVIDCRQTLRIKDHPELHEINIVLGPHPTNYAIAIYFAVWGASLICVVVTCPLGREPIALGVLAFVLAVEVWAIVNNKRLGL